MHIDTSRFGGMNSGDKNFEVFDLPLLLAPLTNVTMYARFS